MYFISTRSLVIALMSTSPARRERKSSGPVCAAKVMLYIMPDGTLNIGKFLMIVVTAIAIGILCGAINGILISGVKIPPMLATMGSNELLMQIGIWVFLAAVLFQIVTLPVEFDASHRAMVFLTEYGILSENEAEGSRRVLRAAAMTYVAAAAAALLNLLRLVMLSRRDDRRD